MIRLKDYKKKVSKILEEVPKSRDNDGLLIAHFLYRHSKRFLTQDIDGRWCIPLKNIKELPPFESIRRTRQIIQNDNNLFLPTTHIVRKARKIKEENWYNCEVREAKNHIV
ncbi:MAG TPA: hypothetical protein ENI63_02060 [Candidatus Kaiserbacteria bacterium]|nr:hypothetical protein [Candidatus Kaiserbacteria bacterium]